MDTVSNSLYRLILNEEINLAAEKNPSGVHLWWMVLKQVTTKLKIHEKEWIVTIKFLTHTHTHNTMLIRARKQEYGHKGG